MNIFKNKDFKPALFLVLGYLLRSSVDLGDERLPDREATTPELFIIVFSTLMVLYGAIKLLHNHGKFFRN